MLEYFFLFTSAIQVKTFFENESIEMNRIKVKMTKVELILIGVIFFAALINSMNYANSTIASIKIVKVLKTIPDDDQERVPESWFEENQLILQAATPSEIINM